MQFKAGNLVHSPHDLVAFLEGEFGSWMDRLYLIRGQLPAAYTLPWDGLTLAALTPDAPTEDQELAAKRGSAHEAQYVQEIKGRDGDLVEIPHDDNAARRTFAEMKAGRRFCSEKWQQLCEPSRNSPLPSLMGITPARRAYNSIRHARDLGIGPTRPLPVEH